MRCKHGDLAIIIQDFEGCEGNLGVIVRVIGPPIKHPDSPHLCWQIMPVSRTKLWLSGNGKAAAYELITEENQAFHPDPWLEPVSESKHIPSTEKGSEHPLDVLRLDGLSQAVSERSSGLETQEANLEEADTGVATLVSTRAGG